MVADKLPLASFHCLQFLLKEKHEIEWREDADENSLRISLSRKPTDDILLGYTNTQQACLSTLQSSPCIVAVISPAYTALLTPRFFVFERSEYCYFLIRQDVTRTVGGSEFLSLS